MPTNFNSGSGDPGAVNVPFELEAISGGSFVPVAKLYFGALGSVGVPVSSSNPLPVDVITMPQVIISGGSVNVDGSSVSVTGSVSISNSITIANGSGASAVNIQDGGNTITVDGTVAVTGSIAHDAAISGNPVNIAARASTATPTAVSADGDVCRLWCTRLGIMQVSLRDLAGDSVMDETNNAVQASIVKELPAGTQLLGSVKITDGTDTADVIVADGYNGLVTVNPGHISTANSTTATLAGGATFTGTWEDSLNYGIVIVSVKASHASASSGLVVQFSSDGVNVDNDDTYTIPAATGKLYSFACAARYIRVVYTNGATPQTYFRLQTVFKAAYAKPSSHRVGDQVSLEDDAELVKAIIAGETTAGGGSMVNVKVNPSGALTVESTLAAGTNYAGKFRITDGTNDVSLLNLTNSKPIPTAIVDGNGNHITSFGGGIQFAEDSAHSSGDFGTEVLAVRRDTPTVGTSANGDYSALSVDKFGRVQIVDALGGPGTIDTFGHLITGQRNNQIDIQFYRGTPASLVTVTTTGSGSASSSGGGAVFATGATTTSSAKGVTGSTTYYSSGGEIFAQFTAAFPTPGGASSFQRIGIYDDNNGAFIGYEGSSFGITTRKATVDTSVAAASFNVDTLTGAASSRFTRNGAPEAINLTYANVFRIRFGWLGEAPIVFEVLSPDGEWVVFHIIKQPNTSAAASINNPELPITCHVSKTAGATDYSIVTFCWGAGCTIAQRRATDSLTTGTIMGVTRAVIAGETSAGGGALVNIKVDPSGAVVTASTLSAGTAYVGKVRITDGTNDVTLLNLTNSKPVPTAIVDASGNQITTFGGGTEYTEDAASAADPVGGVQILVRKDTPAAITSTDGDNVAQRGSNFGGAYTHILTSAGAIVDTFGSSEGPIRLTAQFTRSSTVTAYAVGQVMSAGATLSIANATAVSGGFLEIRDIVLTSSVKGSPLPYANIWILSDTYTAISDYTAVTLSDAENRTVEAVIPLNQQFSATNNGRVEAHGLSTLVKLAGTTLYFIVEMTNAYTPANGEVIDVTFTARRVV